MTSVRSVAAFVLVLLTASIASAQTFGGTVRGEVLDPQSRPVVGVPVTLVDASGLERRTVTATDGSFEFAGVIPGRVVTVSAAAEGFGPATRQVADLAAGRRVSVVLRLLIAGVTDSATVIANTRADSAELGGQLTREEVERVPANGRDLVSLAYLVPGAAPARGFYNLAPRLTINGGSSLGTNYTIDGFDNTDLFLGGPKVPATIGSTDALGVLVNAYSPENGRTGSGVFAVTTRSGGSRRSHSAFYTVRPGAALDSPNVFAPRDAAGAVIDDSFERHQGGLSTGGPFGTGPSAAWSYFLDGEITRERQDAILTSPLAVGLAPTRFNSQTGLVRLDGRLTDRQSLVVRYHGSDYTHDGDVGFIGGLTLPSAGLKVNYENHFGSVTHRTFGSSFVNELGAQVGRLRANWASANAGPRVIVTDRGVTLAVLGSVSDDFFWTETDVQARNVLTWTRGRHAVRVGGDVLSGRFFIDSAPGARGAYVVDLEGRAISPSGAFVSLADIPRDVRVLSYSQSFVNPEVRSRQTLAAAFIEDTIRAGAGVTLTLGARWDYDSVTNTPVSDGDWNNIAPRIGATWTPDSGDRHLFRAGYGHFYERIPFAVYSDTVFNNPDGGAVSVTFAPGTPFAPPSFPNTLPSGAVAGLPIGQLPPRNVQVFDPNLRSPRTEQISVGYEVSLPWALSLGVDYVHTRGRNLIRRIDTNAPSSVAAGTRRSVAEADATRPTVPLAGGFRLIEQDQSSGRSTFDGLYVNLRRQLGERVAFNIAYTLSRVENTTDDINFRPVDSRRPDDDLGPSFNDRRHVLAANGLVRLPWAIDVTPVLFMSSGQPLDVTTGTDDNGDTVFNDRPAGFGRNSERTEGFVQVDLGVSRRFTLGATALSLRADAFNLFNRTNFSGFFNWGASGVRPDEAGTLAFQPTQAGPARQFQFTVTIAR
ncbi:MAG: TonB-dependent receptor [Vicinamibacterales bacterium]